MEAVMAMKQSFAVFTRLSPWSIAIGSVFTLFFAACGDSGSNSDTPEKVVLVSSIDDLNDCSDDLEGDTVFVKSEKADFVCVGGKWTNYDSLDSSNRDTPIIESDLVVATFDDLPVCTVKREGVTTYIKDEKKAYVCTDGNWKEDVKKTDDSSLSLSCSSITQSSSSLDNPSSSSAKSSSSQKPRSSSSHIPETANATTGTMTDSRDGQVYKIVTIGKQVWMAQNLNYETDASYCYKNQSNNCVKYGRLYTWADAMDSAGTWSSNGAECGYVKTCSPIYPVRGVCPKDWHLPTYNEWESLFSAVGGRSGAGLMLKSVSGWVNGGNGTDEFSFTVLPAGIGQTYGSGINEGTYARFWIPTEKKGDERLNADYVYFASSSDNAISASNPKSNAFSIRCVKD
jgi:uncharacterized protein (TIGR02145 family)